MKRFLAATIVCLFAGCDDGKLDRQIKFIVPNDYSGEIRIVKDRNGVPFQTSKEFYTFAIPANGELRTPDLSPFFRWHQIRVEFADGRVIEDVKHGIRNGQGLYLVGGTTSPGTVKTGPHSSQSKTEYDGTTMTWAIRRTP